MTTATAPAPAKAAAPKPAAEEKPLELKDLRKNPEGIVSVKPPEPGTQDAINTVEVRPVLGYGGPIAVEDAQGRGLFKALGGDSIYTLSNGCRYVLPKELGEALGVTQPAASEADLRAADIFVNPWKEAEYLAKDAEKAAQKKEATGKASEHKETK